MCWCVFILLGAELQEVVHVALEQLLLTRVHDDLQGLTRLEGVTVNLIGVLLLITGVGGRLKVEAAGFGFQVGDQGCCKSAHPVEHLLRLCA